MPRILYFDCFSGASGDMILGALLDAGLPIEELRRALGSLAVDSMAIEAERVDRAGVAATKFRLRNAAVDGTMSERSTAHGHHDDHEHHHHGHSHSHADTPAADESTGHHHPHRSVREIVALIEQSALSETGKDRARRLIGRLAEAETAIHQMPVDQVHLHEVGALDSIVDIVGAVFGLEWFAPDAVVASPLNVGSGTVTCAHGTFPVPAPATVRLLGDAPIYSSGAPGELVTPTGALLVTDWATSYGPIPAMRVEQVGYGAGDRDLQGSPNVLRVLVGESTEAGSSERVVVIECEIDDMNPQIFGVLMTRLYEAGALEVFYVPIHMKKDRPGTLVTVVASPEQRDALSEILFRESTTIGVRYHEMSRERLARDWVTVETSAGDVRIKIARRGGCVMNAAPEFDDCVRLATEHGLSVKHVQALAYKAYLDSAQ